MSATVTTPRPSGDAPRDGAGHVRDECFDPALATAPTRVVPVQAVIDLLHVTHAPERVGEYRRAMQRGERFPPIAVVPLAGRLVVADGHKRLTAYKGLPVREIVVEVWTIRRLLRDQWRQFRTKTAQQWRVLSRGPRDRDARREAVRLVRDTLRHWKRIGVSLSSRLTGTRSL
jgi:hypothetical protein